MSTVRTQVQLVNMLESSCQMILKFRFDESVYVVTYITEIICRELAEAIQKIEIALVLTLMNMVYFII